MAAWMSALSAGIGASAQTGNSLIGAIQSKSAADYNTRTAKEFMDIQYNMQRQLDAYGQQLQLDTWKKTNYPAQVEMLKQAGLNPALLYGKGGGGGATTGSQGGGSAPHQAAPQMQVPYMDIMSGIAQMAQIGLIKAQEKKTLAEANAIPTNVEKTKADTANAQADTKLKELQSEILDIERAWKPSVLESQVKTAAETANKLKLENSITTETFDSKIAEIRQTAISKSLENDLTLAKTNLTNEETEQIKVKARAIATEIAQKWTSLSQDQQKIELQNAAIEISKQGMLNQNEITNFNTSWRAKVGQLTGILGNLISGSKAITGSQSGGITINNN